MRTLSVVPGRGNIQVQRLLQIIGMPRRPDWRIVGKDRKMKRDDRQRSFWDRHAADLDNILADAAKCYRTKIKACHPDKPHGSLAAAVIVNNAWKRIKYLFKQRRIELVVLAGAFLLAGCTVTNISGPGWTMHRRSFLQRLEFTSVSISTNGTAKLDGYKTDGGVDAAVAVTAAAVTAAVKAAKTP